LISQLIGINKYHLKTAATFYCARKAMEESWHTYGISLAWSSSPRKKARFFLALDFCIDFASFKKFVLRALEVV
jgi:hypothetical protein